MRLEEITQALVADVKGILAADESTGFIKKRFDTIGVVGNRRESPGLPEIALHHG